MPPSREELGRRKNHSNAVKALLLDYVTTFGSEHGRAVLDDIRRRSFTSKTVVCQTTTAAHDPMLTGMNEGYRMAYLDILRRVELGTRLNMPEKPLPTVADSETIRRER